jgi:uncharacterized repeat protein (TIGR03803 family)
VDEEGTVFKVTPSGMLTTLYTFCPQLDCSQGARPLAGLVEATDGNLYGTAPIGGSTECTQGCGALFQITPAGIYTAMHLFCSEAECADGANPFAGLIQGNLYGTTAGGGAHGGGTIFKITLAGKVTTLYNFCAQANCADGSSPQAALAQGTDGKFYGTTQSGGSGKGTDCSSGCGTVFSLSIGLGPFVETVPGFSNVRATVMILGNNLTGTTNVSFNGSPAAFTVVSGTEIRATVPLGATTGPVKVITPGGTLRSNAAFRVEP